MEELAVLFCWTLGWCCLFHPISLVLPKETGWSPKEKRLWGGGAPVRFRDPPASPTRVGGATRPLRCPLRGRIESLAPRARGWVRCRLAFKSFLPRFFTKKRAGSRGGAPGRAPQRAERPLCSQSAGGGQRGNPRRGFPLCGRPKPPAAPAIYGRSQSSHAGRGWNPAPTGGWRNVARWAVDERSGRRGRRPLRRVGNGPCAAGFTAILSRARARAGGTW